MSNASVQQIDLGLRVLGIDQVEYAVNGERGKTYGQAVGLASLVRAVALESGIDGYVSIVRARERKMQDLNDILSVIAGTRALYDVDGNKEKSYASTLYPVQFGGVYPDLASFVAVLNTYGITLGGWNGTGDITPADLDKIKSDVDYRAQTESTDLQSELANLQSYVSKRDSAFSTAAEMQRKCDRSISSQMKYILG